MRRQGTCSAGPVVLKGNSRRGSGGLGLQSLQDLCYHAMPTRSHIQSHTHESESAKSQPTLCDLMDCNPPGSSVHEIL